MHAHEETLLSETLATVLVLLARNLRQQAAGSPLSPTGASALATLEARGPLRLTDLSALERLSPPTTTRLIERLQRLGWVKRQADPHDRRAARVAVTPAGSAALAQRRAEYVRHLTVLQGALADDQRRALRDAVPALSALSSQSFPRATSEASPDNPET
jgi:DNA-binding MarR family transcriptional regulator